MQVRRAKRVIWIAITLAILFATGVRALPPVSTEPPLPASAPTEPSLLAHATKVMRAPMMAASYQWLSQDIVLFHALYGESGWKATRVNLTTRHVTAFQGDQPIIDPQAPPASPNGRWIVGYADDGSVEAVSLADKRTVQWDEGAWPITSCWLSDNRHWLEVVYGDTEHKMRTLNHDLNGIVTQGPIVHFDSSTPIGITANRHLFCIILNNDRRLRLYDYDLTGGQPIRDAWVTHPRDVYAPQSEVVLSPRGDRIAYSFYHKQQHLKFSMRSQNFTDNPTGLYKVSVWVSRSDGTHMHEVGALAMRKGGTATSYPSQLGWLPDGKHLSFMLYEHLYTVPVN